MALMKTTKAPMLMILCTGSNQENLNGVLAANRRERKFCQTNLLRSYLNSDYTADELAEMNAISKQINLLSDQRITQTPNISQIIFYNLKMGIIFLHVFNDVSCTSFHCKQAAFL